MILSVSGQAVLFATTVIIGFVLGFIYDWIRVFRKVVRHKDLFVHIEDGFYWLCVAGSVFVLMFLKNYADIRIFCVVGVFLGMLLYFLSLSKLFLAISLAVVGFINKVFVFLFKVVTAPFRFALKLLKRPYGFVKTKTSEKYGSVKLKTRYLKKYSQFKLKKTANHMKVIFKTLKE